IFDNNGGLIDKYHYDTSPGSNVSIGRNPDHEGNFFILEEPTQGRTNASPIKSPEPSPSPSLADNSTQNESNPSPLASPQPSGEGGSPTPKPSRAARISDIVLLALESPAPVLGTSSGQTSTSPQIDWPLAVMFLVVGAGLLLATTIIMIRLWRKN
ncbi:MAG: hypothetical protein U1C50_01735, partial [Patescibacteria group bacterium]|nr:hypothetical protein [Patescibacteria group bacterium]